MSLDHGMMDLINIGDVEGLHELEMDLVPTDIFVENFHEDVIQDVVETAIKVQTTAVILENHMQNRDILNDINQKKQEIVQRKREKAQRKRFQSFIWIVFGIASPLLILVDREKRSLIFFILSISVACNNIQIYYGIELVLSSIKNTSIFIPILFILGLLLFVLAVNASFATFVLSKRHPTSSAVELMEKKINTLKSQLSVDEHLFHLKFFLKNKESAHKLTGRIIDNEALKNFIIDDPEELVLHGDFIPKILLKDLPTDAYSICREGFTLSIKILVLMIVGINVLLSESSWNTHFLLYFSCIAPASIYATFFQSLDLKKKNSALRKLHEMIAPLKESLDKQTFSCFPTLDYLCLNSLYTWQQSRRMLMTYRTKLSRKIDYIAAWLIPSHVIFVGLIIYFFFHLEISISGVPAIQYMFPGVVILCLSIILILFRIYRGAKVNHWNIRDTTELNIIRQVIMEIIIFFEDYINSDLSLIKNKVFRGLLLNLKTKYQKSENYYQVALEEIKRSLNYINKIIIELDMERTFGYRFIGRILAKKIHFQSVILAMMPVFISCLFKYYESKVGD